MGFSIPPLLSGPSSLGKQSAYWILASLGGILAATMLLDVYVDWVRKGEPLWAALLENAVPLALALTVVYVGQTVYQRDGEVLRLAEMAKWALVGCVGIALLSGSVIWLHVFPQHIHLGFFVLQLGTVGAVAGLWVGHNIAGVRQAKERMQSERDRLQRLFDGIPSPVVHGTYNDGKLNVLSVNSAFEKHFGFNADDIRWQNLYDLIVPDDRREEAAEIDQRALEEGWAEAEVQRLTTEGPRHFQVCVARARESSSETYAIYADITEQKKRERGLRLFEQVVEQANDAILVTEAHPIHEPGPRIEYVNPAFEEMTGYQEEEIKGKTPRILQGPETDQQVLDSLREALETGEPWSGETMNYRKDGTPYHLRWNIAPVKNKHGEIEHWMSVQRNVTSERRRENELQRQKSLLKQTQRLAGAWEVDLSSGELTWSEEVYRIHELPLGTNVSVDEAIDFYAPEARSKIREVFEQCVDEEVPYDLELPITTAEGNRRWVRTVGAPSQKEDVSVVNVAGAFQDITERKQAEEALQEREARIRGLTNSLPGVVFQSYARPGPQYGFYHVSEHAEELLGISRDPSDFFERCMSRVPKSQQERLIRIIGEAVEAEEHLEFEAPFVKPSGETIWLLGTAMPEPREDEVVFNGVILDITERKVREEELREREVQLQQIRENVSDVVWISSADKSEMEFISEAYEDIWGYSTEHIKDNPASFVEAIHPEDRERVRSALDIQKETPEAYTETYRVVQPEGQVRWVRDRASGVYDEDGRLRKIIGVATDITEAKEYEVKLETVNTRLQLALEATNTGVFDWDIESDAVIWDETSERLFGYGPGEFPETFEGWARRVHHEDLPGAQEDIEQAIEAHEKYQTEFRVCLPDGTQRWIEARGVVEYDDEEPTRMLGIHTDVTERKNREQQLREAKNEAEEASRLKSAMLANMSHEIRTPLTSILGFSEVLEKHLDGELQAFAERIRSGGERLRRTLESVLHLSTLEAGVQNLECEEVSLGEVTHNVAGMLEDHATDKSITLQLKTPSSPVVGVWNEDALHRICRNLVENAIKFTPDGGHVEVRVSAEENQAVLEVEDSGIGMEPDTVSELFKAFKQESEGLDRNYEGSGLGLSIVKRLVEELEGTINVDTEKGEGSCFTVRLPQGNEDAGAPGDR